MREFTKSMLRLSWSMSMLGVQQATNLMTPHRVLRRSVSAMDALSHAAVGQMGDTVGGVYKLGDQLQRGLVDAAARLSTGTWCESCGARGRSWETIGRPPGGSPPSEEVR